MVTIIDYMGIFIPLVSIILPLFVPYSSRYPTILGFPALVLHTIQRNSGTIFKPQDHVNAYYCGRTFVHELPAVSLADDV